eukprot:TRINITY_DN852_c0_g1_i1.p1 TRINITY_DN852_c0_g1~~TRINITY_DN852_c0_g1_i1.p1  ORF type:complete len:214 (+),score=24.79 TRINITY_DN852_c0_g1_i1:118-759(+)
MRWVVLFAYIATAVTQQQGVDVSTLYSVSTWSCLKSDGYTFAIPRGYRSVGAVDANITSNIKNAWAAGMSHVDTYFFPCPTCSKSAATQVDELYDALLGLQVGNWWLDIEGTQYWTTSFTSNQVWFNQWVTRVEYWKIPFGIYTHKSEWEAIFGPGWTGGAAYQLWWTQWTGSCTYTTGFLPFDGWTSAVLQQYKGDTTISACSASVDLNCGY